MICTWKLFSSWLKLMSRRKFGNIHMSCFINSANYHIIKHRIIHYFSSLNTQSYRMWVSLFIHQSTGQLVCQSVCQPVRRSLTHSLTRSLALSLARSLTHSLAHSLTHIHPLTEYLHPHISGSDYISMFLIALFILTRIAQHFVGIDPPNKSCHEQHGMCFFIT